MYLSLPFALLEEHLSVLTASGRKDCPFLGKGWSWWMSTLVPVMAVMQLVDGEQWKGLKTEILSLCSCRTDPRPVE